MAISLIQVTKQMKPKAILLSICVCGFFLVCIYSVAISKTSYHAVPAADRKLDKLIANVLQMKGQNLTHDVADKKHDKKQSNDNVTELQSRFWNDHHQKQLTQKQRQEGRNGYYLLFSRLGLLPEDNTTRKGVIKTRPQIHNKIYLSRSKRISTRLKKHADEYDLDNIKVNILFWTPYHEHVRWWHTIEDELHHQCGQCECMFTYKRWQIMDNDAVLFEFDHNIISKKAVNIPAYHHPDQYWILYDHEPQSKNNRTSINKDIQGGVFNLSAHYNHEADIVLQYGECLPRKKRRYPRETVNHAAGKKGLIIWLVSNCKTQSRRMEYVEQLQQFITVDIAGGCGNHSLRAEFGRKSYITPEQGLNKYKFYLAFENTFCEQYITEKVFKILHDDIKVIPIVRGAGPYQGIIPAGSYIDAADFSSPKDLADHLHKVDRNDTLYNEYFKPREHFLCRNYFSNHHIWPCDICSKVCSLKQRKIKSVLNESEISRLFLPSNKCYNP